MHNGSPHDGSAAPILVVEDDPANRAALVRLLQYGGLLVESALTVAQALEKLKNARPRIVLLDLHLPDGSGARILEAVKQMEEPPQVCVLTGSATPQTLQELQQLCPHHVLLKPFHPEQVMQWVRGAHASGE
jgi:CheY-like chemotaxis protein